MFTWIGAAMPVQKNTFLGLNSVYIGSNSENSENPLTKQVSLSFCDLTYTWLCLLNEFRESSMMTQGINNKRKPYIQFILRYPCRGVSQEIKNGYS